jgi:hypothetical protein
MYLVGPLEEGSGEGIQSVQTQIQQCPKRYIPQPLPPTLGAGEEDPEFCKIVLTWPP